MQNFNVVFDSVKNFWDNSPLAAVLVDAQGNVLYYNSACELLLGDHALDYSGIHNGEAYERLMYSSGRVFKLYVSPIADDKSIINPVEVSVYGEYVSVLGAAVKNAINNVAVASDLIAEKCSNSVRDELDSIDSSMLTLLSEFIIPEQLAALEAAESFKVVSLSEELCNYADELNTIFIKKPAEIYADIQKGMFAAADVCSLKLVISDYILACFLKEYQPENIRISLMRCGADKIELRVACGYISRIQSDISDSSVSKPHGYAPAERLKALLSEKCGFVFNISSYADCCVLSVEIPMADYSADGVHSSKVNFRASSRFSDERAVFARLGLISRYN